MRRGTKTTQGRAIDRYQVPFLPLDSEVAMNASLRKYRTKKRRKLKKDMEAMKISLIQIPSLAKMLIHHASRELHRGGRK